MSVYLGTQLLSGIATNTISNAHDLFDFKWVDHELTDQSWLKADTFSWQDGTVYSEAYQHLVDDYDAAYELNEMTFTPEMPFPESKSCGGITYDGEKFVAVTKDGYITTTTDGITWTTPTKNTYLGWTDFSSLCYGNNKYVLFENDVPLVAVSTDCVIWTKQPFPVAIQEGCVAYGNGIFVAAEKSNTPKIYTSVDGETWNVVNDLIFSSASKSIIFDGTKFLYLNGYKIYSSTDGETWTEISTLARSPRVLTIKDNIIYCIDSTSYYCKSSDGVNWSSWDYCPHLESFFSSQGYAASNDDVIIFVNNTNKTINLSTNLLYETIGSYEIGYVQSADAHKITPDETTAANIYNETGVAWYYVLDQANTRFKLPRTKYGFNGFRDEVGKYIPETLPNINGQMTIYGKNTSYLYFSDISGAFTKSSATTTGGYRMTGESASTAKNPHLIFDASNSSSTYRNNAPVQQRATQMYLYFYVGQFSQSATEQTAGLNASLFNNKVDIDSSWGFPSGTYEDLTLLASGGTYTAPANGWFYFSKEATAANQWVTLENTTANMSVGGNTIASGQYNRYIIPCKKGDTITVEYSLAGDTMWFRFIYAEG